MNEINPKSLDKAEFYSVLINNGTHCVFNRNELIKRTNTTDTNIYFVKNGALKISVWDNDEERILRFGYRDNFIVAMDSFITDQPSEYHIEAIKKSELIVIPKSVFCNLINNHPNYQLIWYGMLEEILVQQLQREIDLLIQSPEERYKRVLLRSPQLFQEVPNKYIANYLRMTPETFSRLKKS